MLSVSEGYLRELNPDATLEVFARDYNPQSYTICGSDMMIKGQGLDNIMFGDSFTNDYFSDKKFDYMLANPPFGVEWKPQQNFIRNEHEEQGFGGRFGAGLPRINDGSFLFLQLHIKPRDYTRLTQKSCGNLCNLVVPTTGYPSMFVPLTYFEGT